MKAYDCVNAERLVDNLFFNGVPKDIGLWIENFLSYRILKLGSETVSVFNGLPQGSCLSPTLFNFYTAELHSLEDESTAIFQFADDFLIVSMNPSKIAALANLQEKIEEFKSQCFTLNLSLNPEKIDWMCVGCKSQTVVKVDNIELRPSRSLTFLGRVISSSMAVAEHYKDTLSKSKKARNLLAKITSVKAGLKPKIAINFYKSFVRSKIEYARTTTANSSATIDRKIQTFQNASLRRCLGLAPSTPIQIIYFLANELPPKERAVFLTCKEIVKLKIHDLLFYTFVENSPRLNCSYSYVFDIFGDVFRKINLNFSHQVTTKISFVLNLLQSAKKDTPLEKINAIYLERIEYYKSNDYVIMATDASVQNELTGFAVYDVGNDRNYQYRIDSEVSSTTGELLAILEAVKLAALNNIKKLAVFTDSKSACLLIKKVDPLNYIVDRIIDCIISAPFLEMDQLSGRQVILAFK